MKTPDDIKKGLAVCGVLDGDCENCPYDDGPKLLCVDRLRRDAIAYIQHLESRLARAERERRAIKNDMESYCHHGSICKHFCEVTCPHPVEGCPLYPSDCEAYVWRGVCEENTKEEN